MRSAWSERIEGRFRRCASQFFGRRPQKLEIPAPLVSFTFDDFPKSALSVAGAILREHGAVGTYYASLGLMGKTTPTGQMFEQRDLEVALEQGHELGCHTMDHFPAWSTRPDLFERSVEANSRTLAKICPPARFRSLSYPIEEPRPQTKRRMARHFDCCRAGGQTFNNKWIDRNALRAYFLDHRNRHNLAAVRDIIFANQRSRGWLIFATHDICNEPTAYGWTESSFREIVACCASSGARIVPVSVASNMIANGTTSQGTGNA